MDIHLSVLTKVKKSQSRVQNNRQSSQPRSFKIPPGKFKFRPQGDYIALFAEWTVQETFLAFLQLELSVSASVVSSAGCNDSMNLFWDKQNWVSFRHQGTCTWLLNCAAGDVYHVRAVQAKLN